MAPCIFGSAGPSYPDWQCSRLAESFVAVWYLTLVEAHAATFTPSAGLGSYPLECELVSRPHAICEAQPHTVLSNFLGLPVAATPPAAVARIKGLWLQASEDGMLAAYELWRDSCVDSSQTTSLNAWLLWDFLWCPRPPLVSAVRFAASQVRERLSQRSRT
ncbi:hypothetical protein McanCB56680_005517 [Microsporum canis]